ncbi:YqhG/Tai3 family protein [Rahnella selenatireducens]|uniref:YbjP/YqhG family protein n=1 Tax=Rahnella selenatireducens TaxID=3389797 RepID=UPI003967F99E
MRIVILLALSLLTACTSRNDDNQQAIKQVTDFYGFYFPAFLKDPPPAYDSPEMRRYVAADTLNRLADVDKIPEQGIVSADYFTYTQDYDAAWIPAFKTGAVRSFMGGKIVDVWLGIDHGKSLHLETYLKREDMTWKIYRVRNISDNYEAPIFSAGRIQRGW